ncbi:MAG: translation initiation factor, partial [Sphingomonas bacterium]|uniref:IF-2-associated domain-containing protein n=1 Tax=Sphingomonas bacterium TaxID=1895847 RepID=UPI00260C57B4
MSDIDNEKPKLGMRTPLGLKRTVETGKVKQSFSHGRSNTVVVEVKSRRILRRPGEAEPQVVEEVQAPEPVAAAPVRAPEPPRPAPVSPANSLLSRQELQTKLLREADESRMNALEETRRREERDRLEAAEEERRRAEENRRAGDAPDSAAAPDQPAPAPAPVEAAAPAAAEAAPAPAPAPVAPPAPPQPVGIALDPNMPAPRRFAPVARPE